MILASVANAIPDSQEIASQLQRMLASRRFLNAPNQADFLKLVVRRALKGKETPGHVIAKGLFADKFARSVSTDVRVTAGNLRATLKKYYAQEGRDDPVVIALPEPPRDRSIKLAEGKAYTPLFSYNPASETSALYREGLHQIASCEPRRMHDGLSRLQLVIGDQPNHSAAHAALAEGFLRLFLFESVISRRTPSLYLPLVEHWAEAAIALDQNLCMARVTRAVAYACRCRWDEAEAAFNAALTTDAIAVRSTAWYPAFLLATGRQGEALAILEVRAKEEPDNISAQLALILFLYATRQYQAARKRLLKLRDLAARSWIFFTLSGLNNLALGSPQWAFADFIEASEAIGSGLHSEGAAATLLMNEERARHIESHQRKMSFPGFLVLCLARWEELEPVPEHAADKLQWLSGQPHTGALQLALAQVGLRKISEAIASLASGLKDGNPLMAWLPLWPVFDDLRSETAFKNLIDELRLPNDPDGKAP